MRGHCLVLVLDMVRCLLCTHFLVTQMVWQVFTYTSFGKMKNDGKSCCCCLCNLGSKTKMMINIFKVCLYVTFRDLGDLKLIEWSDCINILLYASLMSKKGIIDLM